jgi:hypothetical protein
LRSNPGADKTAGHVEEEFSSVCCILIIVIAAPKWAKIIEFQLFVRIMNVAGIVRIESAIQNCQLSPGFVLKD